MVKGYLSRGGFDFTEHNVSTDGNAQQELMSLGYRVTPVTVIDGEVVVGYNQVKLDEALKRRG
ncbi:NrdH-redoxin [Candidatus Pacearchaeota archaeon]|nr:NrdH-redoxin [Candidatus Pacearchaeota archaeon]|tara:strand:+ start:1319 stop:1507 length:189 start_codon:yes stop_codon:yes gene_type:complete